MTEKEKMLGGEFYNAGDPELVTARNSTRHMIKAYNSTMPEDREQRLTILSGLLGKTGTNIHIEPPFTCDYGSNIEWGDNSYANFNCLILDSARVTIGKNVVFAPGVMILTATHPLSPELRREGAEFARPVIIGDDVWIGGGSIINPGVTIGNCSIIGSGSVVTKDIPANSVAVGNPCRVIKSLEAEVNTRGVNNGTNYA
jgi:maltose O-acetyltransferase